MSPTTWYSPGRPMVRALSLWRPWPALIVHAGKRIENRGWNTSYRGLFVIHAGKRWDSDAFDCAARLGWPGSSLDLDLPGGESEHPTGLVAVADLVDICMLQPAGAPRCDCGPWAIQGQYHWRIDNIRPLPEAIPCNGRHGWFGVSLPEGIER